MQLLVVVALVGLVAQLVDGSLGMGMGVISTSLLIGAAGLTPAVASASVNLAKVGAGLASGISHWKFGNVDWRVTLSLAVPGAIGAFAGAVFLASLSTDSARPWTAGVLVVMGVIMLARFAASRSSNPQPARRQLPQAYLIPVGLGGGLVNATGGGGWGPVTMPALLLTGRVAPNHAVGSVSAAEFVVAVAGSIGFLWKLPDLSSIWPIVVVLTVAGVAAAPFAAWLTKRLPSRILGVLVGGLVVAVNIEPILSVLDVSAATQTATFIGLAGIWVAAAVSAVRLERV
ncbi:MAG: sulfite exporter TauE/SafE family protein [Stackebrandtia sp.]